MMRLLKYGLLLILLVFVLGTTPAQAVNPDEVLSDPNLEARARDLSKDLRCVVCRNQSIDDSNAGIARDMRIVLRERLVAGDSDVEAMQFLVDRYGDFILLKPPLTPVTYLLWGAPVLILVFTLWGFSGLWRKRKARSDPEQPISPEDRALVAGILEGQDKPK